MSPSSRPALLLASLLATTTVQAQSEIEISSDDGNLSVQANNVSASELAEELSEQLGISVVVTGDAATRVNLDIVDEPLESALGKLTPNNMVVRGNSDEDITEVVLMMGEGQDGGQSSGSEQFLPSGSPADEVIDESAQPQPVDPSNPSDPTQLRDPNRAAVVRDAAAAASIDANLPADQVPPMLAEEIPEEPQIDPATGLPYEEQQQQ